MTVAADIATAAANTRRTPVDLSIDGDGYTSPYRMQITFSEYSFSVFRSGTLGSTTGSVTLPLPNGLQDAYSMNINGNEMGGFGNLAAKNIDSVEKDIKDFANNFSKPGNLANFTSNSASALTSIGEKLYGSVSAEDLGSVTSALARRGLSSLGFEGAAAGISAGLGTAINPHVALVFDGVNLKTYEFNWTLSPRSQQEADVIRNIVNTIKKSMHPTYDATKGFLEYPSLATPQLLGVNNNYTFTFAPGFIKNLSVDYAPNGMAFNRGGIPSVVNLSFSFEEGRIRTSDDFDGVSPGGGR